jgi:hypothetical protein
MRSLLGWLLAERDSDRVIGSCTLYDIQVATLRASLGYARQARPWGWPCAGHLANYACTGWKPTRLGLEQSADGTAR